MKNNKLITRKSPGGYIKILIFLFISFFCVQSSFGTNISVWIDEIIFNFENGYSYDALTILENNGTSTVPEFKYLGSTTNFAYIKGQSNRRIKVKFDSSCESMHLLINLNVTSGTGIGTVCNFFVENYDTSQYITLNLQGNIPNTIEKRDFQWKWEIYAIPFDAAYCSGTSIVYTNLTYFTLFAVPLAPENEPKIFMLDFACDWAAGKSDANSICTDILNNGFKEHYNWNLTCRYLSSDFVRLVRSIGISASQHYWATLYPFPDIGDMNLMRTKSIDPVGTSYGRGVFEWWYHQWAEVASTQYDPSADSSKSGNWGNYEDILFTHYQRRTYGGYEWVVNQNGQGSGCEASDNRIYSDTPILWDWTGPAW